MDARPVQTSTSNLQTCAKGKGGGGGGEGGGGGGEHCHIPLIVVTGRLTDPMAAGLAPLAPLTSAAALFSSSPPASFPPTASSPPSSSPPASSPPASSLS